MKKLTISFIVMIALISVELILADEIKVIEKGYSEKNDELNYFVDAKYPAVSGLSNAEIEEKINSHVIKFVMKSIGDFKTEMVSWDSIRPSGLDFKSSFEYTYNIENLTNSIFSIRFNNLSYYTGAAHPNTYISSMNFNLESGDLITFKTLFRQDIDHLQYISDYCIFDLKRQGREGDYRFDEDWLHKDAGPEKKNFDVFNITGKGLLITFNSYQVGPYAIGQQSVLIPYKEIMNIVDLDGILKPFLK